MKMVKKSKIGITMVLVLILTTLSGCAPLAEIIDADIPLIGPSDEILDVMNEDHMVSYSLTESSDDIETNEPPIEETEHIEQPAPVQEPVDPPTPEPEPEKKPEPEKEPELEKTPEKQPEFAPVTDPIADATVPDDVVEDISVLAEYSATFLNEDGSTFCTVLVHKGENLMKPADEPEKEEYTFEYWFKQNESEMPYSFGSALEADITLVPYFAANDIAVNEQTDENEKDDDFPTDDELLENLGESILKTPEPHAEISIGFDRNYLIEGTVITLSATLYDVTEVEDITVQWQNNASGEFMDIPGAVGLNYSFLASEATTDCQWQAILLTDNITIE